MKITEILLNASLSNGTVVETVRVEAEANAIIINERHIISAGKIARWIPGNVIEVTDNYVPQVYPEVDQYDAFINMINVARASNDLPPNECFQLDLLQQASRNKVTSQFFGGSTDAFLDFFAKFVYKKIS